MNKSKKIPTEVPNTNASLVPPLPAAAASLPSLMPPRPAAPVSPPPPLASGLELARQLIPKSVRERKFRAGAFFNSLDQQQRQILFKWLADQPVAEVQRRIALPPPEGFGMNVCYTSLHRIKSLLENVDFTSWLDDAMDAACDTLHSESAADAAPLRETISLLLHTQAIHQLRHEAPAEEINKTISSIAKIEKLRTAPTSKPRSPAQKLKLDVTISTANENRVVDMQPFGCIIRAADGCGVQGVSGCEPPEAAGRVVQEERPDALGIVRAPGDDAAGRDQAPGSPRRGEPRRYGLARTREAALSESDAVARDLRAVDWEVRTSTPPGVERSEKGSRKK